MGVCSYVIPPNINLRQTEKLVTVRTRLHDFFERQVHPCVAVDEVAVEGFAVLKLDEHGVALGGGEETQGELV